MNAAKPPTRVGAAKPATRRPTTVAERRILEAAQGQLDFPIVVPRLLPYGYRLVGVEMLEHCRTLVTLVVRCPTDRMRLTQRVAELSLEDELRLTQQPYSMFAHRGKAFAVVAGCFMGEPSDGRWHGTRRSVAWEHDGRICELQQIVASSIPLTMALQLAASCRELPR